MVQFAIPGVVYQLVKRGVGQRTHILVRLPTENDTFQEVATWHPLAGLQGQLLGNIPVNERFRLACYCADEYVKAP